jgi:hypothetical protein
MFRAWNVKLDADPTLRVCSWCGTTARIDAQGRIVPVALATTSDPCEQAVTSVDNRSDGTTRTT